MNYKTPVTLINVLKHLCKLADEFPYSQLALCLDTKNLFDLIRVFGGQTLYIPTVTEFTQLVQFCLVEEIGDYDQAVAANPEVLDGFTRSKYDKLADRVYHRPKTKKERKRDSSGEAEQSSGSPESEKFNSGETE